MFALFIFSLIFITLAFWWVERKFNFFYEIKKWFENTSKDLKQKTKLKIDIFKIIILVIISGLITYLCFFLVKNLYLPYFEQILDVSREGFVLKPLGQDSSGLISNWFVFSNLINDSLTFTENDYSSRIGDWGTFGDFIGGTLNPILTFLSICLILYTVFQNKKSLDINSEELALSRKAQQDTANAQILIQQTQSLQQFDSFFFSLLNQIKNYESDMQKLESLDEIYESIFIKTHDANFNSVNALDKKYELNSYFLSIFEIIRNIYERIVENEKIENKEKIANDYIMILKAMMPFKLQQILMLKIHNSKEYRKYFIYFKFFENTPFYMLDRDDGRLSPIAISLIFNFKNLKLEGGCINGLDAFGASVFLREIERSGIFHGFFNYYNFMEILLNGNGLIRNLFRAKKISVIFDWGDAESRELTIETEGLGVKIIFRRQTSKVFESNVFYKDVEVYSEYYLIRVGQYLIKAEFRSSIIKFYILFLPNNEYKEMKSLDIAG
ncbi:MAG: hypothetical protein I8H98_10500 [Moraxellaceae bacterium]|nr:hypothetical protein [Moraxellaceae bacterium]MBH2029062.1 hypothetical protein [Moraxellaceae bacterium]